MIYYILIGFSILWIVGTLLYFFYKPKKIIIAQTIIKQHEKQTHNTNIFSPVQNEIKNLTVNLIYDEKEQIDTSQFCDLVITVKELLEFNSKNIKETKDNMFTPINLDFNNENKTTETDTIEIEKKQDTNFNKLFNINLITNK